VPAKVILNPYSARWTARKRRPEVEAALQAAEIEYQLVETEGPGHGIELAEQAVGDGFSPLISAGGDGSVSEVANGIAHSTTVENPVPLGIIPLGSANDLANNLKLPKELAAATALIARGNARPIDLGEVNGRYFANNAAIGLEPYITLIQQRITHMKGVLRYLAATLLGVQDNPQWTMHLEWEGGSYHGPVTLVTVGNAPRTGGLFYMTPHADPCDGKLTFVHGYMESRIQILKLLPRTMKPGEGSYVEHPNIHELHTTWLRIASEQPTPAHADGEIIAEAIAELEYRVHPARLHVLM
jgi:diacylglycerol kinase (ATP)